MFFQTTRQTMLAIVVIALCSVSAQAQYDTLFRHVGLDYDYPAFAHISGDTVLIFHERESLDSAMVVYRSYDRGTTWDSTTVPGSYYHRTGPCMATNIVGSYKRDLTTTLVYHADGSVDSLDCSTDALGDGYRITLIRPHPSVDGVFILQAYQEFLDWKSERLYIRTPNDEQWRLMSLPDPTSAQETRLHFEMDYARPERFWVRRDLIGEQSTTSSWVTVDTGHTWQPFHAPLPGWVGVVGPNKGLVLSGPGSVPLEVDVETQTADTLDWYSKILETVHKQFGNVVTQSFVRGWGSGNWEYRNASAFIDPSAPNRILLTVALLPDSTSAIHRDAWVITEDYGETWHVLFDLMPGFGADTTAGMVPYIWSDGTLLALHAKTLSQQAGGWRFLESMVLRRMTTLSVQGADHSQPTLEVHPNPAYDNATIFFDQPCPGCRLSVFDLEGVTMWEEVVGITETCIELPVTGLTAGTYFVTLTDGTSVRTATMHVLR